MAGPTIPLSEAASATIILNVEPGAILAGDALLVSGVVGSDSNSSHVSALMPVVKRLES